MNSKYGSLRLISGLLKIVGWLIVAIGGVVLSIGMLQLGKDSFGNVSAMIEAGSGVALFLFGLVTVAISDAIHVFIDIEANTRGTAWAVKNNNATESKPSLLENA